GFGGLQHCLIPQPKYIILDKNEDGKISSRVFSEQQSSEQFLNTLGYTNDQEDKISLEEKRIEKELKIY
ncbi:MAG: hypothetical protein WBN25_14690, partial [Eudoraea sp.]